MAGKEKAKYKSAFDCARQLYREGGMRSIYKGTAATLLRGVAYYLIVVKEQIIFTLQMFLHLECTLLLMSVCSRLLLQKEEGNYRLLIVKLRF